MAAGVSGRCLKLVFRGACLYWRGRRLGRSARGRLTHSINSSWASPSGGITPSSSSWQLAIWGLEVKLPILERSIERKLTNKYNGLTDIVTVTVIQLEKFKLGTYIFSLITSIISALSFIDRFFDAVSKSWSQYLAVAPNFLVVAQNS